MKKEIENAILKHLEDDYDNKIEIYADRNDFEYLEDFIKEHNTLEDFENALINSYDESYFYYLKEIEKSVMDMLEEKELIAHDKITLTDFDTLEEEIRELIQENIEVFYPVNDFLHKNIKIDLLCDFYNEANYDFTANFWVKWLLHSQGYTLKDFKNNDGSNKFLNSLDFEISEILSHMNALTVLIDIEVIDYFKLLEDKKDITLDKSIMLGAFDCWNGSGSHLEIDLEKDITIKNKNINRIILEDTSNQKYEYSVNHVYGLIGSCWSDGYKIK